MLACPAYWGFMHVERVKYIIWAADMPRAIRFYETVFDARTIRKSEVMAELQIADAVIGIHNGGEGKRTWTGMSFQIADLHGGAKLVSDSGGVITHPPQDTAEEEAHLAMCVDPEGNQFMLTRKRGH